MAASLTPAASQEGVAPHATPERDFPFYNGVPVQVGGGRWALVVLGVLAGAAADLLVDVPGPGWLSVLARAALFVGIPLVVYALAVPGHWRTIFHRMTGREVLTMLGFTALSLVVSSIAGVIAGLVTQTHANGMGGVLHGMGIGDRIMTFVSMVPQLLGEEIFTILPLLAVLWFAVTKLRLPRTAAIVIAWVVTAVLFALIHLPTYGWNIVQCLIIIGSARLVLSLAYLVTKNLWVSTGTHVLGDWTLFAIPLLVS